MSLRRRITFFLKKLLQILLGVLLVALLLEGMLQITDTTDYNRLLKDQNGLTRYIPGRVFIASNTCFENTVVINNLGFHGPLVTIEKPKNTYRIVVIGSSFVEGVQVPVDQMFSILLQKELNANPHKTTTYEVVPIAYSGDGSYQNLLYYLNYGAPLKPDLVIDLETENEIQKDTTDPPLRDVQGAILLTLPQQKSSFLASLKDDARNSKLLLNLNNRVYVSVLTIQSFLKHPAFFATAAQNTSTSTTQDSNNWQLEKEITGLFAQKVHESAISFLVASWSTSYAATSTALELPVALQSWALEDHFFYYNLEPSIVAESRIQGESPEWSCDAHWSVAGNQYAADALYQYLTAHPALINPKVQ